MWDATRFRVQAGFTFPQIQSCNESPANSSVGWAPPSQDQLPARIQVDTLARDLPSVRGTVDQVQSSRMSQYTFTRRPPFLTLLMLR